MKKLLLVILICAINSTSFSQQAYSIKGCISNMPYPKLYLAALFGERINIIDSAVVDKDCFAFSLKSDRPTGMYSIVLSKKNNAYIRFVFNKENVELTADLKQLLSSMTFIVSEENKLFYSHEKMEHTASQKTELLGKLKKTYSPSDKFYEQINSEVIDINDNLQKVTNAIITEHPNTYTSKWLKAQQNINVEQLPVEERKTYIKKHYFDNVDFSYTPLMNTDLLPLMVRNYLTYYENKTYTYLEQEKNYEKAIDALLSINTMTQEMRDFIIKELLSDFQFGDYDILGAYINEQYVLTNTCESGVKPTDVTSRIDKIRRVAVGKPAPEIKMVQPKGDTLKLADIPNDYVLVVFWATTCPHCTEMMPKLKKVYEQRKNKSLEILAISLDLDEKHWNDFIQTGNYTWLNYCDRKGAFGPITDTYNITGTPTFFLIDKNRTIVAKPSTLEEATSTLMGLNLIN